MKTSEKVSIFAYIEREEGITVPSSQSPHARRTIAARVCLQSERRISEEILHFFASIIRGVYFVALNYPFTFKTCRYASGEKERYGGQERFFCCIYLRKPVEYNKEAKIRESGMVIAMCYYLFGYTAEPGFLRQVSKEIARKSCNTRQI